MAISEHRSRNTVTKYTRRGVVVSTGMAGVLAFFYLAGALRASPVLYGQSVWLPTGGSGGVTSGPSPVTGGGTVTYDGVPYFQPPYSGSYSFSATAGFANNYLTIPVSQAANFSSGGGGVGCNTIAMVSTAFSDIWEIDPLNQNSSLWGQSGRFIPAFITAYSFSISTTTSPAYFDVTTLMFRVLGTNGTPLVTSLANDKSLAGSGSGVLLDDATVSFVYGQPFVISASIRGELWADSGDLSSLAEAGFTLTSSMANYADLQDGSGNSVSPDSVVAFEVGDGGDGHAIPNSDSVPEPASSAVMAVAATGLLLRRRRGIKWDGNTLARPNIAGRVRE